MKTPPRPEELEQRACTCAVHCPSSTYHESACCSDSWCRCWCHEAEYRAFWNRRGEPLPALAPGSAAGVHRSPEPGG